MGNYALCSSVTVNYVYFVLKNLVLWARSEFSGSAKRIAARV